MFTVLAKGKYNQRTPGKTPKTPQLRGHPSFCLWNIYSREDKLPLPPVALNQEVSLLILTSIQINQAAAEFFNLNIRLFIQGINYHEMKLIRD